MAAKKKNTASRGLAFFTIKASTRQFVTATEQSTYFHTNMELTQQQTRERLNEVEELPSLLLEATDYLRLFYQEQSLPKTELRQRLDDIHQEYGRSQTYWQTTEELAYGAKVAWRNSPNCIGRLHWETLKVRDLRHLTNAQDIFNEIVEHIRTATNIGRIRSTISIFAPNAPGEPGIRIWNPQFIRYAGYRQADGSVIGDPDQIALTELCQRLGWQGEGTTFDVLPIVIQTPHEPPQWFELPSEVVMEVPITHPDHEWFETLNLKWHALPAVADWRLEIGGISYSCAPFNGWYMSAEIGARNLGDVHRYNLLPTIAEHLGLNTRSKLSLWKDIALAELNRAVLHSFTKQGVRIVDHHTASAQFMRHWQKETKLNRPVPAEWGKIIPPLSASTTEVFHKEMYNTCMKPNFFPQRSLQETFSAATVEGAIQGGSQVKRCPFH